MFDHSGPEYKKKNRKINVGRVEYSGWTFMSSSINNKEENLVAVDEDVEPELRHIGQRNIFVPVEDLEGLTD